MIKILNAALLGCIFSMVFFPNIIIIDNSNGVKSNDMTMIAVDISVI